MLNSVNKRNKGEDKVRRKLKFFCFVEELVYRGRSKEIKSCQSL